MSDNNKPLISFSEAGGALSTAFFGSCQAVGYAAGKTWQADQYLYKTVSEYLTSSPESADKTPSSLPPQPKESIFTLRNVLNVASIGAFFLPCGPIIRLGICFGTALYDEYCNAKGDFAKMDVLKVVAMSALTAFLPAGAGKVLKPLTNFLSGAVKLTGKVASWPVYLPYKGLVKGLSWLSRQLPKSKFFGTVVKRINAYDKFATFMVGKAVDGASAGFVTGGTFGATHALTSGLLEGKSLTELGQDTWQGAQNGALTGMIVGGTVSTVGRGIRSYKLDCRRETQLAKYNREQMVWNPRPYSSVRTDSTALMRGIRDTGTRVKEFMGREVATPVFNTLGQTWSASTRFQKGILISACAIPITGLGAAGIYNYSLQKPQPTVTPIVDVAP